MRQWLGLFLAFGLLMGCVPRGDEITITPPVAKATETPAEQPSEIASPTSEMNLPVVISASQIELALVGTGFDQPVYLTHAFDDRLFVVEQPGTIFILEEGQPRMPAFLDIRDRVNNSANEQGLLSIAFHPLDHNRFFVNYTNNKGDTVISEFQVMAEDPNQADAGTERILITITQPYENHNGGQIQFGPDNYLYIGMGDGGSGGDPHEYGQDLAVLLGKLLRIDVNNAQPYAIPADNPYVNDPNGRDEIWAYGLRNPWRFSFDRLTGDLYIADVGQGDWEEISFAPASSIGGENYGWNLLEGSHCYQDDCDPSGTVLPILEYDHNTGHCSVTGGYVYRGSQFPSLAGNYFYADYCSGVIWNAIQTGGEWQTHELLDADFIISSFGEDVHGELYVLDHGGGTIYHLQP